MTSTPTQTYRSQFVDFILANRYFGWYSQSGELDAIHDTLIDDLRLWHEKFSVPVGISEYGADDLFGLLHSSPSIMFTEEFQVEFMHEYHKVFDELRLQDDRGSSASLFELCRLHDRSGHEPLVGNKKGVFTRIAAQGRRPQAP